jgi:hypothetical protein
MHYVVTGAAGFSSGVTPAPRALAFTESDCGEKTCIS